jgi:hypothetical protein
MSGWATKILQIRKGPPLAERPAYWIAITGAARLAQADCGIRFRSGTYGQRFLKHDRLFGVVRAFRVSMLHDLKAIHAELRHAIAELESILSRPAPQDELLSAARLRLSRLSSRRRSMIECQIFPLLHDVASEPARQIADLRLETASLLVKSSQHIGQWTMRAIAADWSGYQRASADMRASMLDRIRREAAILYPLLEARAVAA